MNKFEEVIIGNARLIHADSLSVINTVPEEYIAVSDPPYGIGFKYDGEYSDEGGEDYMSLLNVFSGRKSVLLQYPEETMKYFVPKLGVPDDCIAWCYNSNTARQFRLWSFFGIKPNFDMYKVPAKNPTDKRVSSHVRSYDWFDDIQQVKNVSDEKTEHPCQVSVQMMERIVSVSEHNYIVDPFMGSGSTGVACVKLGKHFIGIEREKKYFDIAVSRISAAYSQIDMFV